MKLSPFEQWFAAIHKDEGGEEFWPARLSYDPSEGIRMETINFSSPELWYSNPTFEGDAIIGYLDYQRPATLIRPFIQAANPGSLGRDTPILRARYTIVANGLLKNFHLPDLTRKCFSGFHVRLPAFHAWIAPTAVKRDWDDQSGFPVPKIDFESPSTRTYNLENGISAVVNVYSAVSLDFDDDQFPVDQYVDLNVSFPDPLTYTEITRITASFEILFNFFVGKRLESAVFALATIDTRKWNDTDEHIIAESWHVPAWNRHPKMPPSPERMFVEKNTPISISHVLNFCFSPEIDDIAYFMNLVQAAEMNDLRVDDCFIEIVGCLEDFDKTKFGSGKDPEKRSLIDQLQRIITEHGTEAQKEFFKEVARRFPNFFSLKQRLERLLEPWKKDGFRGDPDLDQIVKTRNLKPHGRGRKFSEADFKFAYTVLPFLSALLRYHILKTLGFDREAIVAGFMRIPHRYGMFVPIESIPKRPK